MSFNYQKICAQVCKDLPQRTKDILERRFGLLAGNRETLEQIGKNYNITRERVRQIEIDGISKLKLKAEKQKKIFQYLRSLIKQSGNLKKEQALLSEAASPKFQNHVFFLLALGDNFERCHECRDFHSLWVVDSTSLDFARELVNDCIERFKQVGSPLSLKELFSMCKAKNNKKRALNSKIILSYFDVSKKIKQAPYNSNALSSENQEKFFGLEHWPQITPRGVKDKAYLALINQNRPLHFTEITSAINESCELKQRKAQKRTVHNELIKDSRFVLVGRGIYGLSDWGYTAGPVKDIIFKILKSAHKPLTKQEVLDKVAEQRFVKTNTILLNLSNSQDFKKDSQGRYKIA